MSNGKVATLKKGYKNPTLKTRKNKQGREEFRDLNLNEDDEE